jgi:methionine sulfoxide reductase catalytic subunit
MSMILELLDPNAQAQWVVFYSLGEGADGGTYYDAHSIAHMRSPLTMLACDMNGEPLSFGPGALGAAVTNPVCRRGPAVSHPIRW